MDNKTSSKTKYLLSGGIGIAVLVAGYLMFTNKSNDGSQTPLLPARGTATLANFDDLAKAIPALSRNFVYVLTTSANVKKASDAGRTPEMQAKLDTIWAYNNNKL